jgi:hypothetical protein
MNPKAIPYRPAADSGGCTHALAGVLSIQTGRGLLNDSNEGAGIRDADRRIAYRRDGMGVAIVNFAKRSVIRNGPKLSRFDKIMICLTDEKQFADNELAGARDTDAVNFKVL